ncbi:flagellar motor protein MotB [Paracraurococcus ruber]|uniref:Chemotaxis protein MotB n=1 Tax=Paracraurococcus ruber TaxID=77675 RepID=A0ABS1CZS7_9PROT|nr:flagellar motor protein MotB [Paracraurococcus ruber]MBK1659950.1 chemotaxis protein MotB [Paracraurococcus ruber]TDG28846.1 chemotaxis protein MotB [Paracraurococcus ruber]
MSADPGRNRTIIVKRHTAAHDDHHGGQWKIAYADFVTAMMAFFLVMWLLSSTTEAQREGIARFFTSSSLLHLPSGTGLLDGGASVLVGAPSRQEQTEATDGGQAEAPTSGGGATEESSAAGQVAPDRQRLDTQRLEAMKAEIERQVASNAELREAAQNIAVEMTPEGLRLQIFDREGAPLFAPGSPEPSPRLARILGIVGSVLASIPNEVAVAGHTDAQPLVRGAYGNWELSADRANNARRGLERAGLPPARIFRVEGKASAEPMLPDLPHDPRNRRITVTVLRAGVVAAARAAAARGAPPEARR